MIAIQSCDSGDSTCRLFHSTLRTFLIDHPDIFNDGRHPDAQINSQVIFDACLLYLSQDRYKKPLVKTEADGWVDSSGKPTNDHHFLLYSAKYWNKHVPETDKARADLRKFLLSPNFLTCIQTQSLFIEGQFEVFLDREGPNLRRFFPSWFTGHHDDRKLWRDFRVFIHEWRYLLYCWNCGEPDCQMQQYAGEIDRCLWGALGDHNFMSRFAGRYISFMFKSEENPTSPCYQGISASGDEVRLVRLAYVQLQLSVAYLMLMLRDSTRDQGMLDFICERWSLSGNDPPRRPIATQSIRTDETSTNWLLYDMKSSSTDPIMLAGRAPPVSFSDGCRLLRIGTQIFAEDDTGSYVSLPVPSADSLYIEECAGRGCFLAVASRRVVTQDDMYESGLRDATIAGLGELFARIAPELFLESDFETDDTYSEWSYASESESPSESSTDAYETWSEGSSAEEDIQFDDDPWTSPVVPLGATPESSDGTPEISEDSKSDAGSETSIPEGPLPLSAFVDYSRNPGDASSDEDQDIVLDMDSIRYILNNRNDKASDVHPHAYHAHGRTNVAKGTRASITVFDATAPVPTRLLHFSRRLTFILYDSPPVFHPFVPLIVWPLCKGEVVFADFHAGTFFVRKIRPSAPFSELFLFLRNPICDI